MENKNNNILTLKKEILGLIGKVVTYKRIAGNTIILYFDGNPGESNIKSFWIDPLWLFERNREYVVGSEDFPWEQEDGQSDEEYDRNFEEICNRTNSLLGSKLTGIKISDSNDICLQFDKHQEIRNIFGSNDSEGWIYRDKAKNLEVAVFADHLEERRL
jgi:hypothetical protein